MVHTVFSYIFDNFITLYVMSDFVPIKCPVFMG